MDPAVKSSLLWGLVGGLSFLTLLQGYQLLTREFVETGLVVGVSLVVSVLTAVTAQVIRSRLRAQAGQ